MAAVITVRSLCKQFRYSKRGKGFGGLLKGAVSPKSVLIDAVAGVSFDIGPGERVAIIGPNGAGKSTTLKMLTGMLEPTAGDAKVLGLRPWIDRKAVAYRIGVVFGQRSQLWGELPARDSFGLLRRVYDQPEAPFRRRMEALIERFGLGPFIDQPVHRLSLGQRMRCEITASLLHAPQLLVLDEPTIGLDIAAKAAIRDFILEYAREAGQTVVLTSHDTRDIELVCDRVIVINEGRLVIDQPTDQLRRQFLGSKLVTIQSAAPEIALELPGVLRRSAEPHRSVFEVDARQVRVEQVIAAAVALGGIDDITIEDPPMEEVVREIYAATAQAA
jgi:ABC-2 type transport system ATP-binding protein